jgi:hypothetical protein
MLGVAAVATQNALVKLELRGFPSTAVVTTNTVQLTIDLAVLLRGQGELEDLARARCRVRLGFPLSADSLPAVRSVRFLKFVSDCGPCFCQSRSTQSRFIG